METREWAMADALGAIFTRAALDAAHVRPAAAGDNLANFFKVSKHWRDVARSDGVWKEITPKIWGEGVTAAEGKMHYTYYQRFSKFTMMHGKTESWLPMESVLFVSDTHLIVNTHDCDAWSGVLDSITLPDSQVHCIHHVPHDSQYNYKAVGVVLNEDNIFVGCLGGSVLRGRLGHANLDAMDVLGRVLDCGEMKHFSGTKDYLVGLFMGVQDKSFCVWRIQDNNITIVYKGGDFCHGFGPTDNDHRVYGRIGVAGDIVVACSVRSVIGFDIKLPSNILNEVVFHQPVHFKISPKDRYPMLETFCVGANRFLLVDRLDHIARIRRVTDFVVLCKFLTYKQDTIGFLNKYTVFMYGHHGGRTTSWDAATGKRLGDMRKRIRGVISMAANDRYLVGLTKTHLHVWDATHRGTDDEDGEDDEDDEDDESDESG